MTAKQTENKWIFTLGGLAAILGSLLGMIGNLVHPSTTGHTAGSVAHIIAQSTSWTPIHLTIVVGLILMLGGLFGITQSIKGGLAGAFARFGYGAAIAGITVGVLLVTLDGLAAKHLADAWASAPTSEKTMALLLVNSEEIFNFAIASLFNILFAGVTYILLGLAVWLSRIYPRWLGWVAIICGIGSIIAGGIQAATGESTDTTRILTIIFPTIITLWTALMGILLYRKSDILVREHSSHQDA